MQKATESEPNADSKKCRDSRGFFFPEKMKIKVTEHLIFHPVNTKVMNRKESLLANDFILNCKELGEQPVNLEGKHNKTG